MNGEFRQLMPFGQYLCTRGGFARGTFHSLGVSKDKAGRAYKRVMLVRLNPRNTSGCGLVICLAWALCCWSATPQPVLLVDLEETFIWSEVLHDNHKAWSKPTYRLKEFTFPHCHMPAAKDRAHVHNTPPLYQTCFCNCHLNAPQNEHAFCVGIAG